MSSTETTTIVTPLSPSATERPVPENDSEATLLEMEDVAHDMVPEPDSEALLLGMEDMVQDMVPDEDSQAKHLDMEDTARDIVPERDFGTMLLQMEDMVQDMSDTLLEAATMQETKLHGTSRLAPSVGVSAVDIVELGLGWSKDIERMVIAKKGTRAVLKDPEEFLITSVLSNPKAQEKLKLWLSAARSDYVMKAKFARRPKVWLLTGLYLLEDTRAITSRGQSAEVSTGVSSSVIGALSGVPLGGSLSLGKGRSWEVSMEVAEQHVWAAQYRLLDAHFIKAGRDGVDGVKLPLSMGLYRDVLSVNTVRGAGTDEVGLELKEGKAHDESGQDVEDQDSEELKAYEKRLEEAISVFEKAPSHFLE
ncbi:hypothetical protein CNMCM6936_001665 [Aspergillus lentulus]|uniref:Uncharacterized protein n=1 Tax=Aspergillus lentulus TaxID=293939 RepID=A0AAN6BRE7_ASPLE|nr:hypothetical protein CNMCM6936_001665 [Aspergillus lentulus]KAF4207364.1 hypothetical protein CNMCM8927_003107 [Aspergillus lentulus]